MKKKVIIILFIFVLVAGFVVAIENIATNDIIEVLIENKQTIQNTKSIFSFFSEKKIIKPKYEVKKITKKEFEILKKDTSILIQKNIPKYISLSESIPLIEANRTWNIKENLINITGNNQAVCIIDTGAQTNHPALIGKNATCNIDCLTNPGICTSDCSKTDINGHGTHVAGIIVSSNSIYHGVTTNTKYIPIMACDATGICNSSIIQNGMDWCIANKNTYNISVISMSFGTSETYSSYCDANFSIDANKINNATLNNISVVVATGNGANLSGISEPACINNSIRVGNSYDSNVGPITWGSPTTCSDNITFIDKIVCHTNRNSFFSDMLLAPGALITSTWNNFSYNTEGGTSMSTPHVAGIITLINQYKKLESNKILTPSEIKTILINSGKKINDTFGINLNYSRVNAYNAILYSDEQAPNITYMYPPNNFLTDPLNTNFACNATDNLQFSNLTIKIYNSTELVFNISTINQSLITNYTINQYTKNWSCTAIDNQSNTKIQTNIITVSPIQTTLIPINNTYTNNNETVFNCSIQSTTNLTNTTFSLYENNSLIYNKTENITGLSNYSIFNYNLTNEASYLYSCLSINNNTNISQTQNYTITYDITTPKINLTLPINNTTVTSPTTFTYNETEINNDSCNLTIDNISNSNLIRTLTDGIYNWNITCTDLANNTNTSETRILTIYTAPVASSSNSGGGGGGGGSSTKTYIAKENEIKKGYEKKLKTKDIIKFTHNSISHKLTMKKINTNKVELTIESDPIKLTLYLDNPQKINLDNDKTLDLEVILLSINNNYANIQIKEINETIPIKHIMKNTSNINKTENKTINEKKEYTYKTNINKILYKITKLFMKIISFFKKLF